MKIIGIRDAQQRLGGLVDRAQRESVVLTRHGRPVAVLRGVGGRSTQDVLLAENEKFWDEIEEARNDKRPLLSHDEVKEMFGGRKSGISRRKR